MITLFLLLSCTEKTDAPPAPAPTPAQAEATAVLTAAPEREPPRVPAATDKRIAASHILVAYGGALNALPNITRTRDEAKARAEEARSKVLAGAKFSEIAKAYSDDASGIRGGYLGGFESGTMVDAFETATRALAVGQISALVETPFGFHVIKREPMVEIHGAHLMVTWAGAERAPAGINRSKEEAKARAEEALAKLQAGEDWAKTVRTYSDGPMAEDGGDLGWFTRGQLAQPLDGAAFDLDIGATSTLLESPRGFHIIRRME